MNQYTASTTVRLTVTLTLAATGALTDPSTVALKVKKPDGSIIDLSTLVVRDSTGSYHADYTPTSLGLHMYEWIGSGSVGVVGRGQFLVNQATF